MHKECYAYKNKSGYSVLSLEINYTNKTVTLYHGCTAPIQKYKKSSMKNMKYIFNLYQHALGWSTFEK